MSSGSGGIVTAASADGSLLAVHAPSHAGVSGSGGSTGGSTIRHTVKLYDATVSRDNNHLKATLVASVDAADGPIAELAFDSSAAGPPSFLAARLSSTVGGGRPDKIVVWDLLRGVVSSVLSSPPSTTYHGLSLHSGMAYALSVHEETGRVAVMVHDVSAEGGGKLVRKIKCPGLEVGEVQSIPLGLAVSGAAIGTNSMSTAGGGEGAIIAVRMGPVLRLLDSATGRRHSKGKLRGGDADSDSDSGNNGNSNGGGNRSSAPVAFSSDGRLVATATGAGLQIFDAAIGGRALYTIRSGSGQQHRQSIAGASLRPIGGGRYAILLLLAHDGDGGAACLAECGGPSEKKKGGKNQKATATTAAIAIEALATLRCAPSTRAAANDGGESSRSIVAAAAFHPAGPGDRVVVLSLGGRGGGGVEVEIDEVSYRDEDGAMLKGEVVVGRGTDDDDEDDEGADGNMDDHGDKGRRKRALPSGELVLGPGEAGGEALGASDGTAASKKRAKVAATDGGGDDDDDEFVLLPDDDATEEAAGATIADRLALLTSEMERDGGTDSDDGSEEEDEEAAAALYGSGGAGKGGNKNKRKATTESLATLLRQALASNDDGQLEVALHVRDRKVIENSIAALAREDEERAAGEEEDDDGDSGSGDDMITKLLGKLVDRLGRKPGRAEELSVWVRTVLLILISGKSMSRRERHVAAKLAPLRSMLNERVESLPHLLRLEGRLSLLGQQL